MGKTAQDQFYGEVMAHAFTDELEKIAQGGYRASLQPSFDRIDELMKEPVGGWGRGAVGVLRKAKADKGSALSRILSRGKGKLTAKYDKALKGVKSRTAGGGKSSLGLRRQPRP